MKRLTIVGIFGLALAHFVGWPVVLFLWLPDMFDLHPAIVVVLGLGVVVLSVIWLLQFIAILTLIGLFLFLRRVWIRLNEQYPYWRG